ncbi:MAG: hypothetical protein HUU34_14040 [Saprospiraceae bacterium]|nr:hypothetical protein [Saprospiraceae bacterium]
MRYLTFLIALTCLFAAGSCEIDNSSPEVDENGLTPAINDLISAENLDALVNLGLQINGGATPPKLENEYVVSTCVLANSTAGDTPGSVTQDFFVRLYDQNDFEITVDYRHGTQHGEAVGSYIVGKDCSFSVFIEVNEINSTTGLQAKLVLVVSGTFVNNGIENIQVANLMLDDFGDPQGIWISNGTGRLFIDQDGFSTVVGGSSAWYAQLPDCPCEYKTDIDGKTEMCGMWVDCGPAAQAYHYGATYEIRWAPEEADNPGQQCTYDANKRLITAGIAAGTPDKISPRSCGIPTLSTCDHYTEDVLPWGNTAYTSICGGSANDIIPCWQYLQNWPPNKGDNCLENEINGISHLSIMLGNMNCEHATAIFKIIDESQAAQPELRLYMRGDLNYTPLNLKVYLMEIFAEFDCTDTPDETYCIALQEAIDNL